MTTNYREILRLESLGLNKTDSSKGNPEQLPRRAARLQGLLRAAETGRQIHTGAFGKCLQASI